LEASSAPESPSLSYVLVTTARNEEATIERTIRSVVAQTRLPLKWIIVSDGSTDRTDEIVRRYCLNHEWIRLVRLPEHGSRDFAAKAKAFNIGIGEIGDLNYDIVGNLDADASFGSDYFEFLLTKFAQDPELGVAGTAFSEGNGQAYDYNYTNIEHVTGIIQLFRRECFAAIGGYLPVKAGGIDWIAVTTARMKGWKTRTFLERNYAHHRQMGTAGRNVLFSRLRYGEKDYFMGNHVLWQVFRMLYQMTKKPYVVGGALLLAGYISAFFRGAKRPISAELVRYTRKEQMRRLKGLLSKFGAR